MATVRFPMSSERVEIIHGRRSMRDAQEWVCSCGTRNPPKRKLIFTIPKFACSGCGKKYLDDHDLIFSLADITLNGEPLVHRVFEQDGPQCIPNGMCQIVQINYALECILKSKEMNQLMFNLDPQLMVDAYEQEYPLMRAGLEGLLKPSSAHKVLKMMHWLRKEGFKLEDGSSYRIGDYSYIPCTEYEALCEEMADGVPLLTCFTPGRGFGKLEYCQLYMPPKSGDLELCNKKHIEHNCNHAGNEEAQQSLHAHHMVVLLGPATNCAKKEKGFIFINSHGLWCPRNCVVGEKQNVVKEGIGKVVEDALIYNAIKFWLPGETAGDSPYQFEEEKEGFAVKYDVNPRNRSRLLGRASRDNEVA